MKFASFTMLPTTALNAGFVVLTVSRSQFHGSWGITLASNKFISGNTSQRLGYMKARVGDWSASYENDGTPFQHLKLGDGQDSYRTAAASIGFKDVNVGMRLFTGKREYGVNKEDKSFDWCGPLGKNCWNNRWVGNPEINDYRMGVLYVGYKGYEVGWNHDNVRHAFQNKFAHTMIEPQAWIPRMNAGQQLFTSFRTHNPFTHW